MDTIYKYVAAELRGKQATETAKHILLHLAHEIDLIWERVNTLANDKVEDSARRDVLETPVVREISGKIVQSQWIGVCGHSFGVEGDEGRVTFVEHLLQDYIGHDVKITITALREEEGRKDIPAFLSGGCSLWDRQRPG